MKFLSQNLRFLRESKGWKQSEMPARAGFQKSTWNNYETGVSKPNLDDFHDISKLFGVSESDLLNIDLSTKGNPTDTNENAKNAKNSKLKGNESGKLKGRGQLLKIDSGLPEEDEEINTPTGQKALLKRLSLIEQRLTKLEEMSRRKGK